MVLLLSDIRAINPKAAAGLGLETVTATGNTPLESLSTDSATLRAQLTDTLGVMWDSIQNFQAFYEEMDEWSTIVGQDLVYLDENISLISNNLEDLEDSLFGDDQIFSQIKSSISGLAGNTTSNSSVIPVTLNNAATLVNSWNDNVFKGITTSTKPYVSLLSELENITIGSNGGSSSSGGESSSSDTILNSDFQDSLTYIYDSLIPLTLSPYISLTDSLEDSIGSLWSDFYDSSNSDSTEIPVTLTSAVRNWSNGVLKNVQSDTKPYVSLLSELSTATISGGGGSTNIPATLTSAGTLVNNWNDNVMKGVSSLTSPVTLIAQRIDNWNSGIFNGINSLTPKYVDLVSSVTSTTDDNSGGITSIAYTNLNTITTSTGGNSIDQATVIGSTPVKFVINISGTSYTCHGTWYKTAAGAGHGMVTGISTSSTKVFLITKSGNQLLIETMFPFEGNLADMPSKEAQVIKKFMMAMAATRGSQSGTTLVNTGLAAACEGTTKDLKTVEKLLVAFHNDIRTYVSQSKTVHAFLTEKCGVDLTNIDTGGILGKDIGNSTTEISGEEAVHEDESAPLGSEPPFTLNITSDDFYNPTQVRAFRYGNPVYGLIPMFPPKQDYIYNSSTSSFTTFTEPAYQTYATKLINNHILPESLRMIKKGYGLSYADENTGPSYWIVGKDRWSGATIPADPSNFLEGRSLGVISNSQSPGNYKILPIYFDNHPRAPYKCSSGAIAATYWATAVNGKATHVFIAINSDIVSTMSQSNKSGEYGEGFPGYIKYLDRTFVHELVHGVMACSMNVASFANSSSNPNNPMLWVLEGTAELIHGIDDKRYPEICDVFNKESVVLGMTQDRKIVYCKQLYKRNADGTYVYPFTKENEYATILNPQTEVSNKNFVKKIVIEDICWKESSLDLAKIQKWCGEKMKANGGFAYAYGYLVLRYLAHQIANSSKERRSF